MRLLNRKNIYNERAYYIRLRPRITLITDMFLYYWLIFVNFLVTSGVNLN